MEIFGKIEKKWKMEIFSKKWKFWEKMEKEIFGN